MSRSLVLIGLIMLFCCVPPDGDADPDSNSKLLSEEEVNECELYLSFANTNYNVGDFRSTVDNYYYVLDKGCGKQNAKEIFHWMKNLQMSIFTQWQRQPITQGER